jgi:hypothetical protein
MPRRPEEPPANPGAYHGSREKPPVKVLYLLTKSGTRSFWNRVGAGFVNSDGSVNLKIDFLPEVSFQLRDPKEKEDE